MKRWTRYLLATLALAAGYFSFAAYTNAQSMWSQMYTTPVWNGYLLGGTDQPMKVSITDGATTDSPLAVYFSEGLSVDSPLAVYLPGAVAVTNTALSNAVLSDTGIYVQPVTGAAFGVTGTFWQTTQPVSHQALTDGASLDTGMVIRPSTAASFPVTGAFYQVTQPVSLAADVGTDTSPLVVGLSDITFSDTIVDLTLTDTATVYSYALPTDCIWYEFNGRDNYDFRVSFNNDTLVANYRTVRAGEPYRVPPLVGHFYSGTIYFKCPDYAAFVVEVRVCRKPE